MWRCSDLGVPLPIGFANWIFKREEAPAHGEGLSLCGHQMQGGIQWPARGIP